MDTRYKDGWKGIPLEMRSLCEDKRNLGWSCLYIKKDLQREDLVLISRYENITGDDPYACASACLNSDFTIHLASQKPEPKAPWMCILPKDPSPTYLEDCESDIFQAWEDFWDSEILQELVDLLDPESPTWFDTSWENGLVEQTFGNFSVAFEDGSVSVTLKGSQGLPDILSLSIPISSSLYAVRTAVRPIWEDLKALYKHFRAEG